MRTESDDYKMTPFETVMKYVGIAVAIIYIAMGIAIALRSQDIFKISRTYSLALGGVLILYGLFRAYRIFQRYFQK